MEKPGIAGCKTEGDGIVHGAGTVRVVIHLGGGLVGEGDGEAVVDALGAAVVPGERAVSYTHLTLPTKAEV